MPAIAILHLLIVDTSWLDRADYTYLLPFTTVCDIPGQEFMTCGSACPPTCDDPEPGICPTVCVEGCQCPFGTVLDEDNNRCVELDECGRASKLCV